jgi:hypothetical protein
MSPKVAMTTALAAALSLGAVLWLTLGLWLTEPSGLKPLEAAPWPSPKTAPGAPPPAAKAAPPLFASATGPDAVPEVQFELRGIARGPKDQAALIAIGAAPAAWLSLGATRDGVTLVTVEPTRVVVDTALGFREAQLGAPAAVGGKGP